MIYGPKVDITIDEQALAKARRELSTVRDGMARAVYNALNRTLTHVRATVARDITSRIKLNVRDVKNRLLIRKAKLTDWQATMGVGDAGFDLIKYFKATDIRPAGVRAAIQRGSSTLPRAFIASSRGTPRVLMRAYGGGPSKRGSHEYRGKAFYHQSVTSWPTLDWRSGQVTGSGSLVGRFPIVALRGPSLRVIWTESPDLVSRAVADSTARLAIELDGQIKRLTRQAGSAAPASGGDV